MLSKAAVGSLFCALAASGAAAAAADSKGYYHMSLAKLRGHTIADASEGAQPHVLLKRDGSGSLEMAMQNENTFYLTHLDIGSGTSQKVGVLVDTGSSDLWVVSSNNTYCESGTTGSLNSKRINPASIHDFSKDFDNEDKVEAVDVDQKASLGGGSSSSGTAIDCSEYGTFDPSQSSSFRSNGTQFAITYADNTFANGIWATDDFTISGVTVESLSFAVCDDTDNAMGVLGIGLSGLETTNSGSLVSQIGRSYEYENLPLRLKSQGITSSASYSIFLNDENASDASVLFGAIDHSKYQGNMVVLPLVNSLSSKRYTTPIQLEVTLSSISLGSAGSSNPTVFAQGGAAALLDTGTTLTYLPSSLLSPIQQMVSAQYSNSISSYVVDCSSGSQYQLIFNLQGQDIIVPLSSFLIPLSLTGGGSSKYCMLGIQDSGDTSITLGDSFLRYVYMVADLDHLNVGLAQANHASSGSSNANKKRDDEELPPVDEELEQLELVSSADHNKQVEKVEQQPQQKDTTSTSEDIETIGPSGLTAISNMQTPSVSAWSAGSLSVVSVATTLNQNVSVSAASPLGSTTGGTRATRATTTGTVNNFTTSSTGTVQSIATSTHKAEAAPQMGINWAVAGLVMGLGLI